MGMTQMNIEDYGRWEGEKFILDQPMTCVDIDGNRMEMSEIEFTDIQLPEDVSKEDVVHVILWNSLEA